jgi:hypothetical protein
MSQTGAIYLQCSPDRCHLYWHVRIFLDRSEIPNNILHKNVTQTCTKADTDMYRNQMHTGSLV